MKILIPHLSQNVINKNIAVFFAFVLISFSSSAEKNNGPLCRASITVTPGNSTICYGSSITLTASGGVIYTWNDGEASASITVSPTATTSYIVTGTDGSGCTGTDTVVITVDNPNINVSSSQNLICPGATTTLNTSIESGVSPFTYAWAPSSWLSCSNCSSPVATPPGTINYNVVVTDANGCSNSTSVVVNVDNFSVSENLTTTPICPGSTGVLGAVVQGGVTPFSYLWSPGGGTNSTDDVIPAISGSIYYLTVTDSNGCRASSSYNVKPNDNLNITLPSAMSVCANSGGTTNDLYVQVTGGAHPYTYSWSISQGGNSPLLSLKGLPSGVYSVSVSDSNGCTQSASCNLTVIQGPTINITCSTNTVHPGSPDTLKVSGANLYYWSNGTTGNSLIIHPSQSSEFYVYGRDSSNGCNGNWVGEPVIVSIDPWLPSPAYSSSSFDAPIYYLGNVGIGTNSTNYQLEVNGKIAADSALIVGQADSNKGININGATATITSPTQKISFGNDSIVTTSNVKAGSMQVGYFKADSIKTGTINMPDSILKIGDPFVIITNYIHPCMPVEFQSCGGYEYFGASYGLATQLGVGIDPAATLDVGINGSEPYQFAITNKTSLQNIFTIDNNGNTYTAGNVGIGTTYIPSGYSLAVNGSIIATDVMVKLRTDWPDYVFTKSYKLKSIEGIENFILQNHHLPELPSSEDIKQKGGVSVEEMLSKHTETLEELTLYIIELNKKITALENENEKLKEAINKK